MLNQFFKSRSISKSVIKEHYRSICFLSSKLDSYLSNSSNHPCRTSLSECSEKYSMLQSPLKKNSSLLIPNLLLNLNLNRSFSSENFPPHVVLKMPSLSPTMTEGNLVEWKKKEGEEIFAGDVICVIETDKATLENESQEDGFLAKILVAAGSKNIAVNHPIALIAENSEDIEKVSKIQLQENESSENVPEEKKVSKMSQNEHQENTIQDPNSLSENFFSENFLAARISPAARKLLIENKINFLKIKAKGPKGIITKEDVLNQIKQNNTNNSNNDDMKISTDEEKMKSVQVSTPTVPVKTEKKISEKKVETNLKQNFTDLPTTQIRKIIAKRLIESKFNSPHYYVKKEIILDSILAFRKSINKQLNKPISINDIIIKAVANTLNEIKEANVFWDEKNENISFFSSIDISFAVATEKGLFTPIIKNANFKNLTEISSEVKILAEKAKTGTLKPEEFQGGSFCISNLGMFSIDSFSAIINPPQCGILAVGGKEDAVAWKENEDGSSGPITVSKMDVTLSADNRAIDGQVAGKFLSTLSQNMEDPGRLLL